MTIDNSVIRCTRLYLTFTSLHRDQLAAMLCNLSVINLTVIWVLHNIYVIFYFLFSISKKNIDGSFKMACCRISTLTSLTSFRLLVLTGLRYDISTTVKYDDNANEKRRTLKRARYNALWSHTSNCVREIKGRASCKDEQLGNLAARNSPVPERSALVFLKIQFDAARARY